MAQRVTARFGGTVTLRHVALGAYDNSTLAQSTSTTDYPNLPALLQDQIVEDEVGRQVQTGKTIFSIPAADLPAGVIPTMKDKLLVGDVAYDIDKVTADTASGAPFQYRLEAHA